MDTQKLTLHGKIDLRVLDISFLLKKKPRGVQEKAIRQRWPHVEKNIGSGSPTKFYPLNTLPDEIQIAWASWDKNKYREALDKEIEKPPEKARTGRIPHPLKEKQILEVLKWPERTKYYNVEKKEWDGFSTGLCPQVREVLIKLNTKQKSVLPVRRTPIQPPDEEWGKKIPREEILQASGICKNCAYGRYDTKSDIVLVCPYWNINLIHVCIKCGAPIDHPEANFCEECGNCLRKQHAISDYAFSDTKTPATDEEE